MAYPDVRDQYEDMTPYERRCLLAMLTEEFVLSFPYYSKVVFNAPAVGDDGGPFTYTVTQGTEVRAFSYAFNNGTASAAGFPTAYIATHADTNLGKAQETISGESVEIHGIAFQPIPAFPREDAGGQVRSDALSDARFLALIDDAVSCSLQLNADSQEYWLGAMSMVPGAGGFEGSGYDSLAAQPIDGGRVGFSFMTNGRPQADTNFFHMPEGLVWLPAGKRDSMLNIRFRFERTVVAYSGGSVANNIAGQGENDTAAAGIRGFAYPALLGAAVMVHLKGRVVSKRSMVS